MKFAKFYQYCNGKLIQIPFESLRKGMIFKKSGHKALQRCLSNVSICVDMSHHNQNKQIRCARVRHL